MSRAAIVPALQIATELIELEGKRILAAYVPAVPADLRPVYVQSKGVSTGAYLRTGDGDRRMTEAEIAMVYASRTQPVYDREAVQGATESDLDRTSVLRTLERARLGSAYLRDAEDIVALHRLGFCPSLRRALPRRSPASWPSAAIPSSSSPSSWPRSSYIRSVMSLMGFDSWTV